MTKILLAFTLVLAACSNAWPAGIPFSQALEDALNTNGAQLNGARSAIGLARTARAQYSVAANGGTNNTDYGLGVWLPANSVVQQAYFYTDTQFTPANAKIQLGCKAGAGTSTLIFSSTDISGNAAAAIVASNATGTAATMIDLGTSACQLTAGVTANAETAGKLTLFVDYVVHN